MAVVDRFQYFSIVKSGIGALSGSYGYQGVSLDGDFTVCICVLTDGSTFLALRGGQITWNGSGLKKGPAWPLFCVGNKTAFSGTTADVNVRLKFKVKDDVDSWSSTYLVYGLPTIPDGCWPVVGSSLNGDCWHRVDNLSEWRKNAQKTLAYYYMAFPAHNNGGDVNQVWFSSVELTFEDQSFFNPEYYPGEIYTSSNWGNAVSCNRDGGYFQRKSSNGSWAGRKNVPNNASKSTVFIHNGSGFSTIAPKLGRE